MCDMKAQDTPLGDWQGQCLLYTIGRMEMNIPGKFSVYNALCASSVLLALGVPLHEISAALRSIKGVKGRAEVVPANSD